MIILLISVLIKTFHQGMKLLLFALSWFLSYPPPKNGGLCVNYHNLQLTGGADYFHLRIEKNWGKFIFRITRNLFILWFELEYAPQWVPPPPFKPHYYSSPPPGNNLLRHQGGTLYMPPGKLLSISYGFFLLLYCLISFSLFAFCPFASFSQKRWVLPIHTLDPCYARLWACNEHLVPITSLKLAYPHPKCVWAPPRHKMGS